MEIGFIQINQNLFFDIPCFKTCILNNKKKDETIIVNFNYNDTWSDRISKDCKLNIFFIIFLPYQR